MELRAKEIEIAYETILTALHQKGGMGECICKTAAFAWDSSGPFRQATKAKSPAKKGMSA
jgi:hypothetical protein